MLIEICLSIFIGILSGIITGLIPGIHINLIGAFLISFSNKLLYKLNSIYLAVFVVSMAITHTFVDFIPSIFLGCPDTDTELSVLPGHDLLKKGRGYEAISLANYGSLASLFLLLFIAIPSIIIIPKISNIIQTLIPYLLILILLILILLENKKLNSIIVISLTGTLGLIVLNLEILKEPLLPLLTGLFGSSMLILSIKNKIKLPKQKITKSKIKSLRPILAAIVASPLCSFLPGLGSGQAAIIGNTLLMNKKDKKGFLILIGATNTLVMGFSFLTLYLISRTRTGAAATIKEIIGIPHLNLILFLILISALTGIFAFYIVEFLAKFFSKKIENLNYSKLSLITLIFLSIIIFLVSGFLGLGVFITSTLTGIYCISLGVRRTNMMGCLLIPTILLYLL